MWVPGSYTPKRETLPYPDYGTLNFFDQTASHVLGGHQVPSRHGDPAAEDRPGDRRPLLRRRQQRRPGVVRQRHRRLRLRDRRHALQRHRLPAPATCSPGQQPPFGANPTNTCLSGEGNAEGQEFASGNYGLLQSALDYQNDTAAPVVGTDVTSDGKGTYTVKFTSNEASSIYYTTDGSTPTTASTEWEPPRARALPLPLDLAPGTKLQWIAKDFKGNVSGVKSQVLGQTDTPGTVGGSVPATLALTMGARRRSARSRRASPRRTRRPPRPP